jgi:hypothetical protein
VRCKRPVVLALVQHRCRDSVRGLNSLLVLQSSQELAQKVIVESVTIVVNEIGVPVNSDGRHCENVYIGCSGLGKARGMCM